MWNSLNSNKLNNHQTLPSLPLNPWSVWVLVSVHKNSNKRKWNELFNSIDLLLSRGSQEIILFLLFYFILYP